jgi:acyl transferase domain-containing protein
MGNPNDIAIVGMALRVPGARDVESFWRNLRDGHEALTEVSAADLKARGVATSLVEDPNYVRAGMPLAGFDEFDPEFFGFSPIEAAILDPQHRQFYEVAWEALESAGCVPARFDGAIGVFAGCGAGSYFARNILQNAELLRSVGYFLLRHTGNDKDFLATRVSYAFNLKGPSISVQTACSTSLVATHMGVQSLLARETDLVLAGGVTIEIPHGIGYLYHEGEIQSPDGHCRPFDHRSQGTVFGSGVGVVALRRLEDALRDGNPIYAVIRSSAINNDGASKVGYLAPSVDGQAAAISEALALADIDSSSIEFVECHGTGTPLGDPIEVAALNQAFGAGAGKATCILGSVKANIGHLDTAAGVISLIKAALSLQHEAIPPTPNFEAPNPALGLENGPFTVTSKLTAWPRRAATRRAAVNSLGVGGTNAFVVLEEAPRRTATAASNGAQLLTFSARSRHALDAMQQRLLEWLQKNPDLPLGQIAASMRRGREAFEHRRCVAATSVADAVSLLGRNDAARVFTHVADGQPPPVVFMFPGGGAQYPAMAAELYRSAPAFRGAMDEGFGILARDFDVDLRAAFLNITASDAGVDALLNRPSVQLPLVFLIEYALVALWKACGVTPSALIGHSMGENTAACIAGVLSLKDGLGLVLLRGRLMDEVPDGGMLSVAMGAADLAERLGDDLDLAAANSPMLSIASGPWPALVALQERLKTEGIESRRVRINIAAHSRLLDGILQRFGDYLRGVRLNPPALPIVSNLTGTWLTAAEAQDPDYWVRHLRNTIRFVDGAKLLLEDKSRVYLEVGPGNILGSFVRQSHAAVVQRVLASLRHPDDMTPDDVYFRTVAGRLWALGLPLADDALWSHDLPMLPLPTYAFQHERFWIEATGPEPGLRAEEYLHPEALPFGDDWLTGPRWIQLGIPESESERTLNWCVFHHHDPLAKSCIEALRRRGDHVTEVIGGDTFARIDADIFTLAPEVGGAAYDELLEILVDENRVPDRVLHTWLLTRSEAFRPGQTFLHRNQMHGFYSLFHLARAFAKRAEGKSSHWIVAANGVVSIAGEPVIYPEKATVLGPCAVIPRELKGVTCAFADVAIGDGDGPSYSAYGLLQELNGPAINAVLAWRDRVRWMRYLAPHHPKASGQPAHIRDGGTYLITGGFGGIAGAIAEWLARDHRARLLLLSRTPLPHQDAWDEWLRDRPGDSQSVAIRRIRKLEALGAKVEVLSADVTVQEQVEEAIAGAKALYGAIHGVFHTAGMLRDGLIALKNERDIEEVLAAKLYGTLVLDQVLRDEPMDFMLLFSSISTFTAPVGQVDYVAANAFLNAYAEACRGNRPYHVVAVNWGIWRDVGMAATAMGSHHDAHQVHRGRLESVRYPLFNERRSYKEGRSQLHVSSGSLSARRSWITDDHRLRSGQSLVPGSGYLELIRAALAEIGEADAPWKASAVGRPLPGALLRPRIRRTPLSSPVARWSREMALRTGCAARRKRHAGVALRSHRARCRCRTPSADPVGYSGTCIQMPEDRANRGGRSQVAHPAGSSPAVRAPLARSAIDSTRRKRSSGDTESRPSFQPRSRRIPTTPRSARCRHRLRHGSHSRLSAAGCANPPLGAGRV